MSFDVALFSNHIIGVLRNILELRFVVFWGSFRHRLMCLETKNPFHQQLYQ